MSHWMSWNTGWRSRSRAEGRWLGSSSRQRRARSLTAGERLPGTSGGAVAHAIWRERK